MEAYERYSECLKAIAHPTRLAILEILGAGEQCVCHLEATLELRQAYISQQLMILKNAGLVEARRDGLNLYYRIARPGLPDLLAALSAVTGVRATPPLHRHALAACPCPKCQPAGALIQPALPKNSVR